MPLLKSLPIYASRPAVELIDGLAPFPAARVRKFLMPSHLFVAAASVALVSATFSLRVTGSIVPTGVPPVSFCWSPKFAATGKITSAGIGDFALLQNLLISILFGLGKTLEAVAEIYLGFRDVLWTAL
ncbi:hypothetical protein Salat_0664300 [Sesamum alatum]|uniref:Uncharacterized protein n=1 Tax=Sesamum alatum TaxID=300844 RepID=A0AAE1YSR7_9LAMI|nr:hypothetical protein Salat_0664300 [Sesamum alatum]